MTQNISGHILSCQCALCLNTDSFGIDTSPFSLSDSLALEIAYGLGIDSPDHPILHQADEAMNAVKCGLTPGKWLVDILPFRESLS